jgi:hypothetical protein
MPLLLLVVLLPVVLMALMPFILIQRYRVGSSRRLARPWMAAFNVWLMAFSTICFLAGAAMTQIWVPNALAGAVAGVAAGVGLGIVGLALTRWESTPAALHYTPNRWLVFLVTFVVSARVLYGAWRSWTVAEAGIYGTPMVLAFGIPESLAAGGMVIGYYVAYSVGVRRRITRWQPERHFEPAHQGARYRRGRRRR